MKNCCNVIVSECFYKGVSNASSPIGHNIAYFRNKYGKDISIYSLNHCMKGIIDKKLNFEQSISFENLKELVYAREGSRVIEGFGRRDIDTMIRIITTG